MGGRGVTARPDVLCDTTERNACDSSAIIGRANAGVAAAATVHCVCGQLEKRPKRTSVWLSVCLSDATVIRYSQLMRCHARSRH